MKKPLPKRFYSAVDVARGDDGQHIVTLDGKPVRTPARGPLAFASEPLARLVASEWEAQSEVIDPGTMPVTRLVNTALDGVARDPDAVAEDMARYAGSDMLCYRADTPVELVDRNPPTGIRCFPGHARHSVPASSWWKA